LPKEFTYRGYTMSQLQQLTMDDFIRLLPSRQRRSLVRGLNDEQKILFKRIREAKQGVESGREVTVETHCRDMVILPDMVGLSILVHNGKEFVSVNIRPEMIGHYLGEFASSIKKVVHGSPGIGASRSSMYVPLK